MKIRYFGLTLTLLVSLFFASQATADDIEVKSENIIFVGDVSEADGEKIVRNLEVFRETLLALVDVKNKPDQHPLRVYGIANDRLLGKYVGGRGLAGVYTQGLKGPVFVTVTKGGFDNGEFATQVALHEYSHHVLHGMSRDDYPRWYDEGFANYLSTFKIEDDLITIGAPNVAHGKSLRESRWMSPETVFKSIYYYPRTRNIAQFYGQSWLYVHYMQNNSELGSKLPDYLENLKSGQKPIAAFESAYGMTVREFHNAARDYWGKDEFPVLQFKAGESLLKPKVTIRSLSEDEAALAYADGARNFMSKKKAKELKKTYKKLSSSMGTTPTILSGLAHTAMVLDEYGDASNYVSQALLQSPLDIGALSLKGDIAYHKLYDNLFDKLADGAIKTFPANEDTKLVASDFEKALSVDPTDYTAVTHLTNLYGRSNLPLNSQVKKAIDYMAKFYLTPHGVGEHIDLAYIYMRLGEREKACRYHAIAKNRVEGYTDKKVNDDYARAVNFERTHPNCIRASN